MRSLLVAGIPVALGSDGPTNPYLNIMLATLDPNRPSEAITREQAMIAYTLTSAYAELMKRTKAAWNQESSLTWLFFRKTFSRSTLRNCQKRNRY